MIFEGYEEMRRRVEDPDLVVDATSVLVLRGCGPVGGPGMPEWGMIPIPARLVADGVRDMVRVTDARMSGTSFGTVFLHVAPEGAVGGPLALVEEGDEIAVDADAGRLDLLVEPSELARRRAAWRPLPRRIGAAGPRSTRPMSRRPRRAAIWTSSRLPLRRIASSWSR